MKPVDMDITEQMREYHEECQDDLIKDLNVKREYLLKVLKEPITIENYNYRINGLNELLYLFKQDIEMLEMIRMYYS